MIKKRPRQSKLLAYGGSESFDTEGLRRVVPAVNDVHPQIFREGVGPVRTFTCDESVDTKRRDLREVASGAPADNTNLSAGLGTAREEDGINAEHRRQAHDKSLTVDPCGGPKADVSTFKFEKRFRLGKSQSTADLDVIAKFGMSIQG